MMDQNRKAFLDWWCDEVPEYMREKWKENVDEVMKSGNATEKLAYAWEGFQFGVKQALTQEERQALTEVLEGYKGSRWPYASRRITIIEKLLERTGGIVEDTVAGDTPA
jgi:hypothetical protein